jgi:hypothetical protein
MTHRQRMLAACRGEPPDRIPWVPRLDLWYNAHSRAGTLPEPFRGLSLREITAALGLGYHAVVPDFLDARTPEDIIDRGLGIFRLKGMAYETRLREVDREVTLDADVTRVTYRTPVGAVSCAFRYTEEMKRAGASLSWIEEHALKGPDDYAPLEHIFSHLEVAPTPGEYRAWQQWVGEDGLAVAYINAAASPMQHIMRDLMPMTDFFLELHDHPQRLASLARSMEPWFEGALAAVMDGSAEVVFLGANYDDTITYPPFFEEHILPWLTRAAGIAHRRGKLLLTHTDGENAGLMDLYRRCGFDIADSICPAPMTKLTLAQVMEQLPGVTIWGGLPSVALCPSSMSNADFARLVQETLALVSGRTHIILSVADTMPADASYQRFIRITEIVGQ